MTSMAPHRPARILEARCGAGRAAVLLAAVLLAALAVRVYSIAATWSDGAVAQDSAVYLNMARLLGSEPTCEALEEFDYHPGYPAAVLALARITGAEFPDGWIVCGQAVSAAMSLLAAVGVYALGAMAFNRRVGLLAAAFAGLGLPLVELGSDAISDASSAGLVMISIALALPAGRALRSGRGRCLLLAAGAGLASGLGYLVRPEALIGGLVAGVLLIVAGLARPRRLGLLAGALAALLLAIAAATGPYMSVVGGLSHKKGLEDFTCSSGCLLAVLAYGSGEALEAARRVVDRLREASGNVTTVFVMASWVIYALARRVRAFAQARLLPRADGLLAMLIPAIVLCPLAWALEFAQGGRYISTRHLLLPALALTPLAGAGLMGLAELTLAAGARLGLQRRPRAAYIGWCIAAGAALVALAVTASHHEDKAFYRQAGQAIRSELGPGLLVYADDPRVGLYAASPPEQYTRSTTCPVWLTDELLDDRQLGRKLERCGYEVLARTVKLDDDGRFPPGAKTAPGLSAWRTFTGPRRYRLVVLVRQNLLPEVP